MTKRFLVTREVPLQLGFCNEGRFLTFHLGLLRIILRNDQRPMRRDAVLFIVDPLATTVTWTVGPRCLLAVDLFETLFGTLDHQLIAPSSWYSATTSTGTPYLYRRGYYYYGRRRLATLRNYIPLGRYSGLEFKDPRSDLTTIFPETPENVQRQEHMIDVINEEPSESDLEKITRLFL